MDEMPKTCQGTYDSLLSSSGKPMCPTRPYKFFWQIGHQGLREALKVTVLRLRRAIATCVKRKPSPQTQIGQGVATPTLGLKPGELVRVRSEADILETLDSCDRHKGMAWMPLMAECCGKEFTVYKRVDKMVLESTGEIRKLKDTVLLEQGICDGIYGCDRSCFFFWKEAWLERVEEPATTQG